MVKGIIFDLDGVLVNSESVHFEAYKKALENFDFKLTQEKFDKYIRSKGKAKGLKNLLGNCEHINEIGLLKDEYFMNILEGKPDIFYEDALALLEVLKETNLKMAVATASSRGRELLELYNMDENFDVIVTAGEVLENKPSPQIYNLSVMKLNLKREEIIVIEDSIVGIEAALGAKLKVLGIRCDNIEGITVLNDLRDVMKFI